jgi:4-amino-4-deoxy-L-arabinose transferase-like glycosyltransferase
MLFGDPDAFPQLDGVRARWRRAPPSHGAEYVTLHRQLLSGGDRLANLPQWFASMGSLFVVSLIAARLGATARGQALAALFCATLPMGILQSTSTQNDFVVAYWLACLVALVTDATTRGWPWVVALGAALGSRP